MTGNVIPVLRLSEQTLETDRQSEFYESATASRLGDLSGLQALGFGLSVVPPGKSGTPFHNHHVEDEMFVVLEGQGSYRYGSERHAFAAGDVLIAPAGGQETAHQIVNTGTEPLKFLAISSKAAVEVCEYPDSGKFLVKSYGQGFRHMSRHPAHHIDDYWDGEPGA
jgi:uncharacterized cupin superfamily protein